MAHASSRGLTLARNIGLSTHTRSTPFLLEWKKRTSSPRMLSVQDVSQASAYWSYLHERGVTKPEQCTASHTKARHRLRTIGYTIKIQATATEQLSV